MDDRRGNWHNTPREQKRIQDAFEDAIEPGHRQARFVIELEIGERITVVKSDGTMLVATFDKADANNVFLTPVAEQSPLPYMETAERVSIEWNNGESVTAQVWDRRNGKLVLRTLAIPKELL